MNAAKIKKANEIFQLAVELPLRERASFLTAHCAGDADLQAFVEQLLSHDAAGMAEFMCRPVFTPTPDQTQDPEQYVPKRVGRYAIIRKIGEGGMGIVYEARQDHPARSVALKLLRPGLASGSLLRRFQHEADVLGHLQHPGIACIYEAGVVEEQTQTGIAVRQPFFAMELIRGQTLDRYVKQNNISMRGRLELLAKTCEAVQHAHHKGVIHRDLKPGNILIDESGSPKILDFGVARATNADIRATTLQTDVGQLIGTVAYMSPEQVVGDPQQLDTRSDVYALGVILYELLTGTYPYPVKGEVYEVVKHIAETEPKPPSKVRSPETGVSERKSRRLRAGPCPIDNELQTIVLKALSKNRERRYQSAKALRQDIIHYLAGEPIEAKRDSSLYVLKKSLRRHRVRIAVTVGFMAVAALALYVGSRTGTREAPALALTRPITSLAVLPLANLSGDPDQDYFSDGITGELITTLGKIKALKVISRMSVMAYKDTDKSPPEIARELKVDALVAGTVALLGDRVRIAVNLIKGDTSEQLWGDSYERDMRDILGLQSEVARAIAEQIKVKLTPQEQIHLASARPVNPEAYEAYLIGRFHKYKSSPAHLEIALEYFQLALEKNPNYALAYAGIADAWGHLGGSGGVPPHEAIPKGKAAMLKAIELDDTLAEAHDMLARFRFYHEWDWGGAETEFKRAIELNPNYADARLWYADFLSQMKRPEEARAEIERGLELDPLNFYSQFSFGQHLLYSRRYDDAIAQFRKTLRTEPNCWLAHEGLWVAFHQKGMDEEALAEAKKFFEALADSEVVKALTDGYAEAGYPGAMSLAAEKLAARSNLTYVPAMRIARLYVDAGEKDRALEWLEKAYEERALGLVHLSVDSVWDTLRDDPRYKNLLRRMGLPPARAYDQSPS